MKKIVIEPHQKLWFTSDTHYAHKNICLATTTWADPFNCRKFSSLDKMNATIVNNINECVGQDDILFHLGDWSFGGFDKIREFREQIVCRNIHLILGNHDNHIENDRDGIQAIFSSVHKYLDIEIEYSSNKIKLVLMHFPIASWDNLAKGAIHLHGHIHMPKNRRVGVGKVMDVGMDGNDYKPMLLSEIISIMNRQPIKSMFEFDHHEVVENYK